MRLIVPVLTALVLAAPVQAEPTPHSALALEVAQAERAFDAYTHEHGFTAGFLEFAAPDGILLRPDPVNAHDYLESGPVSVDTSLRWWPGRVGVAISGDLAFDAGPWTVNDGQANGWFFTIWKRQPDGRWLWALDHGSGSLPGPASIRPETPVQILAPATAPAGSADLAWREVEAVEAELAAQAARSGLAAAYQAVLAADSWIATHDAGPAEGEAIDAAIAARPPAMAFEQIGGEASGAGDFAWTYGHARWRENGADARGHYVRVWRRDAGETGARWALVYDQLTRVAPRT